jgi:L-ribulose-5-phosphate 3-epimerase UlaE
MKINKTVAIITGVGLAIGFAEALVYYNLGANANNKEFKFGIPKGKELAKNMTVVLVTSALTALLSYQIEKSIEAKSRAVLVPA